MALNVGELYAELTLDQKPFEQGVSGIQGKLSGLGGMITGVLGGAVAGAFTALGGAVVGGIKSVNDYQKAINNVSAQTGIWGDELDSMSEQMKRIYSRNFGESFEDIANTMAIAKQATGAVGEELEYLTQDALMLRDTFAIEVEESLRGADMMMQQFGTTGTEAMAFIAEATQKGLNKNGDLVDTIEEYSVYFKQAGLDAEDMFGILENASKAGVRNLDYVGDAFKEMVIRTKDGSKTTIAAYDALGLNADKMMNDFAKGGETGKKAFTTMMDALNQIKDPVEKNAIGVALFGTKFEDLEAKAIEAMGNMNGTIKGSVDTLNEINEIKYDDFGSAMQGIGRQLQVGLLMPLGEKLLPYLNKFANWVQEKIPQIMEFFSGMGDDVGGSFSKIAEVAGPILDFIGQKFGEMVTVILEWWQRDGQALLTDFQTVFNAIWGVIQFVMPAIKLIISGVMNAIKGIISGALNIISGAFKIFAGLLTGDWSKMWEGVKQLLKGAVQLIWNYMNLMMFGRLLSGIKTFASSGWNLFKSFGSRVKQTFSDFINNVVGLFNYFKSTGSSIWRSLIDTVKNIVSSFVSAVKTNFGDVVSSARTKFGEVKNAIMNPIKEAKKKVLEIIQAIKDAFSKMKISIPKPDLPKLKVGSKKLFSGKGGPPPVSVPTFDWFKTGGIATGPAIAGIGEAGSEAIVPLAGRRMRPFAEAIAKEMGGGGTNGEITLHATLVMPDGRVIAEISKPYLEKIEEKDKRVTNRGWGRYK